MIDWNQWRHMFRPRTGTLVIWGRSLRLIAVGEMQDPRPAANDMEFVYRGATLSCTMYEESGPVPMQSWNSVLPDPKEAR